MNYRRHAVAILLSFGLLVGVAQARSDNALDHRYIRVELGAASTQATSGRLLLFAVDAKAAQAAVQAAQPAPKDARGPADFRKSVAGVMTRRAIEAAAKRAGQGQA